MIKSIALTNFQGHKDSLIELSEGVNVLIGDTDAGKSSIIRALKWLMMNQPSGDSYRYKHAGDSDLMAVEVVTSEGHKIIRRRGKGVNEYEIDGEILKAMKGSVPPEISEALNMQDVNWQFQHDGPFLLGNSSGEVSRYLNDVANLQQIDTALKNAVKASRAANGDLTIRQELCQRHDKEISKIKGPLAKATRMANALQRKMEANEAAMSRCNGIVAQFNACVDAEAELTSHVDYSSVIPLVDSLIKKKTEYAERKSYLRDLKGCVTNVKIHNGTIKNAKQRTRKLEEQYTAAFPDECPLCGSAKKRRKGR